MQRHASPFIASLLAATLLLAACSEDGDTTTTLGTEPAGEDANDDAGASGGTDDGTAAGEPSDQDGATVDPSDDPPDESVGDSGEPTDSDSTGGDDDSALSGSGGEDGATQTTTTAVTVTTVTLPDPDEGTPVHGSGPIDPGLQPFIDVAAADLSSRLGIARGDITVQSAVLTVWPDTSNGCPDPRMEYAQVTVDGAAIELIAAGQTHWYHSGGTQGPELCESPLRTAAT